MTRRRTRREASDRRPEEVATLTIDTIAAGGAGVGRIDGLACFVPRTAPGDVVQVAYVRAARHATGRVLQRLSAGPGRVTPACRHYDGDRCGGCQLQHLDTAAQQAVRRRIVAEALRRIGGRTVPEPALVSGVPWGYRSRLTLALRRRGSAWIGGLHAFDDPGRIFPLEECPISHPALVAAWSALRPLLRERDMPLPVGDALRLSFRLVPVVGAGAPAAPSAMPGVAVVVQGGNRWDGSAAWGARAAAAIPGAVAVWWEDDAGHRTACWSSDADRSPVAFAQVNLGVADRLHAHVLATVRRQAPRRVIDAYAGTGRLSLELTAGPDAGGGLDAVVAIEADADATATLRTRLADGTGGTGRVTVLTAPVEEALPSQLPADVVVLNPPRRGVAAAVAQCLEGAASDGIRAVIYVSCDPATLARDLARMPRWVLRDVTCFDLFPQTAHVETVCLLTPQEGP